MNSTISVLFSVHSLSLTFKIVIKRMDIVIDTLKTNHSKALKNWFHLKLWQQTTLNTFYRIDCEKNTFFSSIGNNAGTLSKQCDPITTQKALRLFPECTYPERYKPDLRLSRSGYNSSRSPILMYPGSSAYRGRPPWGGRPRKLIN